MYLIIYCRSGTRFLRLYVSKLVDLLSKLAGSEKFGGLTLGQNKSKSDVGCKWQVVGYSDRAVVIVLDFPTSCHPLK